MSSVVSKLLPMAGFGLLGLLPAMAGTWLWTRHSAMESAATERRQAEAGEALTRLSGGDLATTLRLQNSLRDAELKTATAFLTARQQAESGRNAGERERITSENQAADEAEAELKKLIAKVPAETGEGNALKEQARNAAQLSTADWQELKSSATALEARLGTPVQQKDLPALESDVRSFDSKVAKLPSPADWEQKTKSLLEEWHRKVTVQ